MAKDTRQSFTFPELGIRGVMVSLDAGWHELLKRRKYDKKATQLLGELCAVSNLMNSTVKFDGRMTLQLTSPSALKLAVVQCYSDFTYRGMINLTADSNVVEVNSLANLANNGNLVISIQAKKAGKFLDPYQGVVAIENESLSGVVTSYFNQSEQLKTEIKLFADEKRAFGVLLQAMPNAKAVDDDWLRLKFILGTLTLDEMKMSSSESLIRKLFVEDDIELYDVQPLDFFCTCSEESTLEMLGALGVADLENIIVNEGKAMVECDFCGRVYEHHRDTLVAMQRDKGRLN